MNRRGTETRRRMSNRGERQEDAEHAEKNFRRAQWARQLLSLSDLCVFSATTAVNSFLSLCLCVSVVTYPSKLDRTMP